MDLSQLPKTTSKSKRRLGQGYGTGRGKTAGRGTKGQKARAKIPQRLKLSGVSFVKRLPLFRGKLRHKRIQTKPLVVNLKDLKDLKSGAKVDLELLTARKLVKKDEAGMFGVKILGDGKISVPLNIYLPTSNSARKKIEKAGGKVYLPVSPAGKPD